MADQGESLIDELHKLPYKIAGQTEMTEENRVSNYLGLQEPKSYREAYLIGFTDGQEIRKGKILESQESYQQGYNEGREAAKKAFVEKLQLIIANYK